MNKHIYCAKPMTRTIAEARRVKAAVLASKVTTKASLQDSRSSAGPRHHGVAVERRHRPDP